MKKTLIFISLLTVCLIPIFISAQTQDQSTANLLKFMKGDGAFEQWFMQIFTTLDTNINSQATGVAMFGRAIGAFGALCYLGYLGWQMQEGARPWEVTPMLRPIFISLILSNWTGFTTLISAPFQAIAQPGKAIFADIESDANALRIKRFDLQNKMLDIVIKENAENKAKNKLAEDAGLLEKAGELITDGLDKITAPIEEFSMRMQYNLQHILSVMLENLGLWILRICTYLIFFIQKIWAYILIVLGPVAVGMSLIPGFENSLTNWISKFININLYTFISYIIVNIGQQLIMAGYQMEIQRYTSIIGADGTQINKELLMVWMSNQGFIESIGFTVVAYVVTGIAMLMVPSIADAIVQGSGAHIMSKAKAGSSAVAGSKGAIASAGKAAAAVKTGGASAIAGAAKEIGKSIKTMNTK